MRLLQSNTLELKEFSGEEIPLYVILSHTWGEDEVSFHDMRGRNADKKLGYTKIKHCCTTTATDGFEYVWIDTCCIDKTSSSELSEAINSMFRWYQDAEVCYIYLSDVPPNGDITDLYGSKWFTRGWTLQELLAPSSVIFFSNDWQEIGTKLSLEDLVSKITRINEKFLLGTDLKEASIAQRMSWASRRKTTRVEDLAYSLIGIFGVNMPMLYAEGERAFIRLQEEIMKISDDHTIFAWKWRGLGDSNTGLLALSSAAFWNCDKIISSAHGNVRAPFTVTNRGICVSFRLVVSDEPDTYQAILDCQEDGERDQHLGIWVKIVSEDRECFERTMANPEMVPLEKFIMLEPTMVCIKQKPLLRRGRKITDYDLCDVTTRGLERFGLWSSQHFPSLWGPSIKSGFLDGMRSGIFGGIRLVDNY